jgi:hypothetical protein
MGALTRDLLVFIGVGMVVAGVHPNTRMSPGLFSRRPPTHDVTIVGRICFVVGGLASIFVGVTGITEFLRF